MAGKWVFVIDCEPNDGCVAIVFLIIVFMLLRGCREDAAAIVAPAPCPSARGHRERCWNPSTSCTMMKK
jgi:hypothetical protein